MQCVSPRKFSVRKKHTLVFFAAKSGLHILSRTYTLNPSCHLYHISLSCEPHCIMLLCWDKAVAVWVMSEWDLRNHHVLLGSAIIFELSWHLVSHPSSSKILAQRQRFVFFYRKYMEALATENHLSERVGYTDRDRTVPLSQ